LPEYYEVLTRSSLTGGAPVLADAKYSELAQYLELIHTRFRILYCVIPGSNPTAYDPNCATDVEWKLGADDMIYIKQARLLLAAVLALASAVACGGIGGDDCVNDPSARHTAKNPATGACWEFTDSCDVPADWADCGDCPGIIDCAPGYVLVGCECVPQKVGCTSDDDCAFTQPR